MAPDSVLPLLCLCCFLLPVSVACPEHFPCGHLGDIHFPFFDNKTSPSCGLLPIAGCDDPNKPKTVKLGKESDWLPVEKIYQKDDEQQIIFRDPKFGEKLRSNPCSVFLEEHPTLFPKESPTLSYSLLNGISHLKCKHPLEHAQPEYPCDDYHIYDLPHDDSEWADHLKECSLIQLPSEQQSLIYIQLRVPQSCIDCHYRQGICQPDGKCSVPENKKIDPKSITIGVAIGSVGVIMIGLIIILLRNKRRHKSLGSPNQSKCIESDNTHSNPIPESKAIYFELPVFSYEELEEATNKFDPARQLGRGGFGTVYYGKLEDGREVAVKHLFQRKYEVVEQFKNEVKILTRLRHRNLVSLYGCTSRASRELLLVYEYISNGTLGCHLHGNLVKPGSLPWPVRMRIAMETANALSYLHACGIIHRDVKSSNLLLDDHFCVKVADFGISRLFPKFVSHVSTAPAGTPGYLDPEYHQSYQLTGKSDVYSFGVVLIELISSKPAIVTRANDKINSAYLAVKKIQRGAFSELVDPSIGFESDNKVKEMINSVAKLAFQCLQREGELRPSMYQVMEILQKIENGEDDLKHIEFHGAGVLNREIYTSLPTSVDWDEVGSSNESKPQRHPYTA